MHVHHTVNSNDYAPEDVPALLRGIYRYHTKNLGWSDVGYNFLVDRFGGIWQGRAGGSALAVRGAHTLGFNSTSTGIAVIGNFEEVVPERAVIVRDRAAGGLEARQVRPQAVGPRRRSSPRAATSSPPARR